MFDTPVRGNAAQGAWSVSYLTQRIRGALEGLGRVAVEGEVSGGRPVASGHIYFDLKDIDAQVACVIWRSAAATALRQPLREGDKVVVHGKLEVYGQRGRYQIIVQRVEPAGLGSLLAQLERLKVDLKARGWLDRRRPVPQMPRRVGVVTSRDGAAFQDFLRTRTLRWPLYPVVLAHTSVQGAGAAASVAAAIRRVAASGVDIVVVTRGGGSVEDLWAFNELAVAEAIWECPVPVVSGVGHETDTTLCDLVADRRAHTPTDAATQVIPDRHALVDGLERLEGHLAEALTAQLDARRERIERAANSSVLRSARGLLDARRERLGQLERVLSASVRGLGARAATGLADLRRRLERRSPAAELARRSSRVDVARAHLRAGVAKALEGGRRDIEAIADRLAALSPLGVLARGYSITYVEGRSEPVTGVEGISVGAKLRTRVVDGEIASGVSEVAPLENR